MGLFALAIGAANDRANRAAAMQSSVFFTLKLLVEVELQGHNVGAGSFVRAGRK
jgi:hypothetical protein